MLKLFIWADNFQINESLLIKVSETSQNYYLAVVKTTKLLVHSALFP